MIPYCVQTNDITTDHLNFLYYIQSVFSTLADHLTCHSVCEVIISLIKDTLWEDKWQHVKGRFNGFDHSWLYNEVDL